MTYNISLILILSIIDIVLIAIFLYFASNMGNIIERKLNKLRMENLKKAKAEDNILDYDPVSTN